MTPALFASLPTAEQKRLRRPLVLAGPHGFYAFPEGFCALGPRRDTAREAHRDLDRATQAIDACPAHQRFDAHRFAMAGAPAAAKVDAE
jgi:hypothetical protein